MFLYAYQCSTPFELHDDNYVLKQMRLCDKPLIDGEACTTLANTGEGPSIMADAYNLQTSEPCSPKPYRNQISQPLSPFKSYYPQTCTPPSPSITYQHQMPLPSRSNTTMKTATSPPLPGILKSRVQHER